ncbi:MAG: 4-hydroxy-3-methylbut-2-enyl diphosphate reductase [Pseudomonadota bacterium]
MKNSSGPSANKPSLEIRLAAPRGFCAGVDRAIAIVKSALAENGPPIYVRHEIVHNGHVVSELRELGAVFVDELSEVPADGIVVFSAHGVPKSVPIEAKRRRMLFVDATCPLVSKVHREVEHHVRSGRTVLLIGHQGHPEVAGTMGQVSTGSVLLIESPEDARSIDVPDPKHLAFATQTTLSVRDTSEIIGVLRERFPDINGPRNEDICYATTNRQDAVAAIAPKVDAFFVVGAENSSNSKRLVEVAMNTGCSNAHLIADAAAIDWDWLNGVRSLGLSAGASAPEVVVQEIIKACAQNFDIQVEEEAVTVENVYFRSPPMPRRKTSAGQTT